MKPKRFSLPDRVGDDLLIGEVSDDVLEKSAQIQANGATHYTMFFCTALDLCPAP
jgi:hypothetical protein